MNPIRSRVEYDQLKEQLNYMRHLRPRGRKEEHQEWIDTTKVRLKDYRRRRFAAFARRLAFFAAIYASAVVFFWWYEF